MAFNPKYHAQYKWKKNNKEKVREYDRKYKKKYREEILKKKRIWAKKWREENREKSLERQKAWKQKNRDKILSYRNKYTKTQKYHFLKYKYSAANRNHLFELTFDEFKKIREGECHYCGNKEKIGIDRKDSSIGYTPENCVPCCASCNYFKGKINYKRFIENCIKIGTYLNSTIANQ